MNNSFAAAPIVLKTKRKGDRWLIEADNKTICEVQNVVFSFRTGIYSTPWISYFLF